MIEVNVKERISALEEVLKHLSGGMTRASYQMQLGAFKRLEREGKITVFEIDPKEEILLNGKVSI